MEGGIALQTQGWADPLTNQPAAPREGLREEPVVWVLGGFESALLVPPSSPLVPRRQASGLLGRVVRFPLPFDLLHPACPHNCFSDLTILQGKDWGHCSLPHHLLPAEHTASAQQML